MFQEMLAMSAGGEGGSLNNATLMTYTIAEMQACTDANPIIINGNFEGKHLFARGYYSYSAGYQDIGYNYLQNLTLGTKTKINLGTHSSYTSWRYVTVYSDKIVIGSGGYGSTENSNYGLLEVIAVD